VKNKLGFLLRVGVSLAALGGLVYFLRDKWAEVFGVIRHGLEWEWFLISVLVYVGTIVLASWRLQYVFGAQGVKVSFLQTLYLSCLGIFFTLFFPSSLGGDIAKGYFAYQYSGKKFGSFTGVILDRILGFASIVFLAVTAFLIYSHSFDLPIIRQTIYGAVGLLIFAAIFFAIPGFAKKFSFLSFLIPSAKWRQHLTELYHAIRNFHQHQGLLWFCLALSVIGQVAFFVTSYLFARAISIDIPLWPFFVLMPLVTFVSLAPSLSGLGVREAGFVFFFKAWMTTEQAFALSLVYDFVFYGSALLTGLVFAFKGGLRKNVIHDMEAAETLHEVGPSTENLQEVGDDR
jgi:uncharacterized protein (TIRG00374 family)